MGTPNVNTLWGRAIADELAKAGIDTAVLAPGSRSTPLAVAIAQQDGLEAVSLLDERSAAFFALGYAKRTGRPAPLVCTSGTALANFHPAVIEADAARVPMVLLTADRPPELTDSGANQTIDQTKLYGDAVRTFRTLPEPEAAPRKLRSLRTALCRAVGTATGTEPGPVHLNVPFRKPLEPIASAEPPAGVPGGEVPDGFEAENPLAAGGRDGSFVDVHNGPPEPSAATVEELTAAVETADSGLIVCGPTDGPSPDPAALSVLAGATGFPVFADPLSGLRFGPHTETTAVCGGYDAYLPALERTPDVVVRFGASPTSKPLRHYLRDADARQFLVDPAGGWREATFTATDLVVADGTRLATALADTLDRQSGPYADRLAALEAEYWRLVEGGEPQEGGVLADVVGLAPDPATVFVSNSMPVRDLDRFGAPRPASLSVLGNRGASGIDGILSTALGAGLGTDDPLVAVVGDLAYYHDMNGLLAVSRADVDATIVCINNDGGGIFHLLPIEANESFEQWFRTPHGLDFEPSTALYDIEFARADSRETFRSLYSEATGSDGTQLIEVRTESGRNHAERKALREAVIEELGE